MLTSTERLRIRLDAGDLQCLCGKRASSIKNGTGVCARCLSIEKGGYENRVAKPTKLTSPNAKYAEWGIASDSGHKTEALRY